MIHIIAEIMARGYQFWARGYKVPFKGCQICWTSADVKASHAAQIGAVSSCEPDRRLYEGWLQGTICLSSDEGISHLQDLYVCQESLVQRRSLRTPMPMTAKQGGLFRSGPRCRAQGSHSLGCSESLHTDPKLFNASEGTRIPAIIIPTANVLCHIR